MVIKRKFYNRNTVKVAQDLLGCLLVRRFRGKVIKAKIIETEAYRGEYDLACHASKGRTPRTETLYGEPGRAYVYLIYGIYYLFNVVAEKRGFPGGVLIRAVEMEKESEKNSNGPGKLTGLLHIDKSLNGWDLTRGEKLWIDHPAGKSRRKIIKSPRIGIGYARHCRHWKWNFKIC